MKFTIDIEPTNRCNAKCGFCPRDRTPHQGLMTPPVFTKALARAVEYRDLARDVFDADASVSLCGLGEPLLNRETPNFVRQVRETGLKCVMSSNASLLDERAGEALLDAGLQTIFINAGDEGEEYEDVYKLPFDRTRDNIASFVAMARGRCEVVVILVNHHNDLKRVRAMKTYWKEVGVESFQRHDIMNRGGSLYVDEMQYLAHPYREEAQELLRERGINPICGVAFVNLVIGYDGQYYLCCSDWEKRVPLGSVFDESFLSITRQKLHHVSTHAPICETCNHDPINQLADGLRDMADDDDTDPESLLDEIVANDRGTRAIVQRLSNLVPADDAPKPPRRQIPVTAE